MSIATISIILLTTIVSSFISGIFGMAGGLILMGVIVAIVPVATAMILHGAIMMAANSWRAWLLRDNIDWPVFRRYLIGAAIGLVGLTWIAWRPDKTAVYLVLAAVPILVWIPKSWLALDIRAPGQAEIAGVIVQGLNSLAGVAGPLLDAFFVRTDMTRQEIVATKSATQAISHLIKILFWSVPFLGAAASSADNWPPALLIAAAIPLSMLATYGGKRLLDRMTDTNFQTWVKSLITGIGAIYFVRAAAGLGLV
ncbi:MAG: sulfite exporter TauE/SafE family protein [Pseudomonadota bacterium]